MVDYKRVHEEAIVFDGTLPATELFAQITRRIISKAASRWRRHLSLPTTIAARRSSGSPTG